MSRKSVHGGIIPAHAGKTPRHPRTSFSLTAHPRSRGENSPRARACAHGAGSSPLTRGKPSCRVRDRRRGGLIPAHAGKTFRRAHVHPGPEAHPRSRGENDYACGCTPLAEGSSPLTRGKPSALVPSEVVHGLIPAHAGKTSTSLNSWSGTRAHPRSRGENIVVRGEGVAGGGSSPLTRGKQYRLRRENGLVWLIPAHAGKTDACPRRRSTRWAHPRSRGENWRAGLRHIYCPGSSPLTRGKLHPEDQGVGGGGLIPAHAGKTDFLADGVREHRAHPRSRGENVGVLVEDALRRGSSPLTRGKPHSAGAVDVGRRLIPAHAGKTSRSRAGMSRPWAHPRSRGENERGGPRGVEDVGSSPLTRGKRAPG